MRTTLKEIQTNTVQDAILVATPFNIESAKLLGSELKANSSIKNLDLSLCNLVNEEFSIIAEALISRKENLSKLNLNGNDLTPKSFEAFQGLIQNNKVKLITIFKCDDLIQDAKFIEELKKCAFDHDVKISSQNPLSLVLELERKVHETLPIGPEQRQAFSIRKN